MFLKKTLFLTLKRCWVQSDQHQLNDCWCCGCSVAKSARHLCHPEFAQTHVHWVSDAIWPFHPLLPLLLLPSVFPSIRVFSNESALCIRWLKYWSFSFSIHPSNEYSGLISFRMDWFDLLTVQRTFQSLVQHHSLKASVLWCSTFFMVQLSYIYKWTTTQPFKKRWNLTFCETTDGPWRYYVK